MQFTHTKVTKRLEGNSITSIKPLLTKAKVNCTSLTLRDKGRGGSINAINNHTFENAHEIWRNDCFMGEDNLILFLQASDLSRYFTHAQLNRRPQIFWFTYRSQEVDSSLWSAIQRNVFSRLCRMITDHFHPVKREFSAPVCQLALSILPFFVCSWRVTWCAQPNPFLCNPLWSTTSSTSRSAHRIEWSY